MLIQAQTRIHFVFHIQSVWPFIHTNVSIFYEILTSSWSKKYPFSTQKLRKNVCKVEENMYCMCHMVVGNRKKRQFYSEYCFEYTWEIKPWFDDADALFLTSYKLMNMSLTNHLYHVEWIFSGWLCANNECDFDNNNNKKNTLPWINKLVVRVRVQSTNFWTFENVRWLMDILHIEFKFSQIQRKYIFCLFSE